MNHEGDAPERGPSKRQERRSVEVWADNLTEEMVRMSDIAESFLYVALDTQFPGPIIRPMGPFDKSPEFHWQMLKGNLDLTKVLQLTFTFSDSKGNRPKGISTWRFNFAFNRQDDFYSQEVVEQLALTRNLDIQRHVAKGIQPHLFAELLLGSGLVLNEEIRWITYRGTNTLEEGHPGRPAEPPWVQFAGLYDFGHLLIMLRGEWPGTPEKESRLPDEPAKFFEELDLFFPCRCDLAKHLHKLPQLNGTSFRNAHQVLEAFFRLNETIRRTAFEAEDSEAAAAPAAASSSAQASAAAARAPMAAQRKEQRDPRQDTRPKGAGKNGTEKGARR